MKHVHPRKLPTRLLNIQNLTKLAAASLALLLIQMLAGPIGAADKAAPKAKTVELTLDADAAVVLDADRNGLPAKTKLIPTASYDGYSLAPVVDGVKKRTDLGWQDAAWASAEDENPHGIEIQFSRPQHGGRFQVTWAYDANDDSHVRWWISRHYVIQVKDKAGDDWKTVVEVKNNQSVVGSYPLPETPFSFLRIYQLPEGGHAQRPNLMWVGQVELVE
jgi:hypothetical protein